MQEQIEEFLENEFEFIKFEIKYIKPRLYNIKCELLINDKGINKLLRTDFDYQFSTHSTIEANLGQIRFYVNKAIKKMFERTKRYE